MTRNIMVLEKPVTLLAKGSPAVRLSRDPNILPKQVANGIKKIRLLHTICLYSNSNICAKQLADGT